jgi:hypothetical protein
MTHQNQVPNSVHILNGGHGAHDLQCPTAAFVTWPFLYSNGRAILRSEIHLDLPISLSCELELIEVLLSYS